MWHKHVVIGGLGALALSLAVAGILAGSSFDRSAAIPVPENLTKIENATSISATDQEVRDHLEMAEQAVMQGNNTLAIIELIKAVELEHGMNIATLNQTAGSNQTMPERNMGAMGNDTTGLEIPDLFR